MHKSYVYNSMNHHKINSIAGFVKGWLRKVLMPVVKSPDLGSRDSGRDKMLLPPSRVT